ncbi:MAG: hypothetical protein ACOZHQ_16220 [Thermodesulfobacteriota bacterium]
MPLDLPPAPPRTSWPHKLAVLVLMAVLATVMTWPLAAHPATAINDFGDPLLNAWILWWVVQALFTPGLSLFNAPIFHPAPLTLAYSEHLVVSGLTAAPVLLLGGDAVLAHNFVFWLSFVLAGYGAYLLGWELTGSRGAALVCALGFAFAPYRFGHLGHLQLQTAHFMPLVLLYLHRWAREPRWSHAVFFGLFWVLQILSCGYYALFISLAVGLFLLHYGLRGRWWGEMARLRQLGAVCLALALIVAPFFWPYSQVKKEMGFVRSQSTAAGFSATPGHYLAAPPANLLYGQGSARFRGAEGELFLGLGLTGLALLGLARPRRRQASGPTTPRRGGLFLGLAALCGLMAGLVLINAWLSRALSGGVWMLRGPELWGLGGLAALAIWRVVDLGGARAALKAGPLACLGLRPAGGGPAWAYLGPDRVFYLLLALVAFWASLGPAYGLYALMYKLIPGFDALRVPARLAVLVSLAWAVLAGFGWRRLEEYWRGRPRLARGALIGLAAFILLEACSAPIPWLKVYDFTPEVYQWLARQPKGAVIFEVPTKGHMGDQARDARYLYWSTKHGQTLINGYSGYFPPDYEDLTAKAGRLPELKDLLPELRRRGADHLVVHVKEYPRNQRQSLLEGLRQSPELDEVFTSQWDHAFRIKPKP